MVFDYNIGARDMYKNGGGINSLIYPLTTRPPFSATAKTVWDSEKKEACCRGHWRDYDGDETNIDGDVCAPGWYPWSSQCDTATANYCSQNLRDFSGIKNDYRHKNDVNCKVWCREHPGQCVAFNPKTVVVTPTESPDQSAHPPGVVHLGGKEVPNHPFVPSVPSPLAPKLGNISDTHKLMWFILAMLLFVISVVYMW